MTIVIADNSPRVSYAVSEGATQTSFAVPFEFFANADLNFIVDGTTKTLTTHYTVSGGSGSTGTITTTSGNTITGATGGSTVVITRDIALERTTDFPAQGSFQISSLNTELDRFTAIAADINDISNRGIHLADYDTAVSTVLPVKDDRKGKVLGFNATTGAVEAGPSITDVQSLSAVTASIALLGTSDAVSDMNTLATSAIVEDMNLLATSAVIEDMGLLATSAVIEDMGLLATSAVIEDMGLLGTSANVTAMGLLGTSAVIEDMGILSASAVVADMALLATTDVIADMALLADSDVIADMALLATSDVISDMNTLATSDIVSDLNTLATSDIVSDLNALATSDIISDMNALATSDIISDMNSLATSAVIADMASLAGSGANPNITSVTASGDITGSTFAATGDTAAGDNASVGYTAAEGLILTGQGSTNDVTIKNDADADVIEIPTGTTNVTVAGNLGVGGTVTGTGTSIFADLDISGDIDVDGTTNLDNTDIDGTLVVDGTNISLDSTTTLNIDNSNTSNGITIGTATSAVPVSIGHTTSETTVNDNLTVTGNLTVNGTNNIGGSSHNIVYNGAMNIAQRGTSSTGIGASSGYFTLDRWKIETSDSAGRLTMTQTADGPSGFLNCLKLECTTADTSIAAAENLSLRQRFEGQDLQLLKKGTSDAEQITVSFYVKGNASATYVCELYDNDNTRNNTQAFSVTTSWNRVSLTFAADTTGALDDDNNLSFQLNIWLHGGSTYTGGTFASNTWASVTNANRYAGSRTSFYDSTSRTFFITGVQMEVGSSVSDFQYEKISETLANCQRYYQTINPKVNAIYASGYQANSERISQVHRLGIEMRAEPTCTVNGTFTVSNCSQPAFTSFSKNTVSTHVLQNSGSAASAYYHANDTGDFFSMDAEL